MSKVFASVSSLVFLGALLLFAPNVLAQTSDFYNHLNANYPKAQKAAPTGEVIANELSNPSTAKPELIAPKTIVETPPPPKKEANESKPKLDIKKPTPPEIVKTQPVRLKQANESGKDAPSASDSSIEGIVGSAVGKFFSDSKPADSKTPDLNTAQPPAPDESLGVAPNLREAIFTSSIANLKPVDELKSISANVDRVNFYTRITGLEERKITHRWMNNDKVLLEKKMFIGSQNWRTWSSMELKGKYAGNISVEVLDDKNNVIGRFALKLLHY